MPKINYRIDFINYNAPQRIPSECNGITFINLGTAVAIIETIPLQQYQQLIIGGDDCEYIDQTFQLQFQGPGTQSCGVVKKVYI